MRPGERDKTSAVWMEKKFNGLALVLLEDTCFALENCEFARSSPADLRTGQKERNPRAQESWIPASRDSSGLPQFAVLSGVHERSRQDWAAA